MTQIRRQNLASFIERHMRENENFRAKVYDALRERLGLDEASPADIYGASVTSNDLFAAQVCIVMIDLNSAQKNLTEAALRARQL